MYLIGSMYITLMPVIIMGVLNMIWMKLPILESLRIPIDNNIVLKDNERLFGKNKTWKGFIGYLGLGILSMLMWALVCSFFPTLYSRNFFYVYYDSSILYNIIIGFALGFAYVLFELPNSFIKRRFKIEEGKTTTGLKKYLFVFLDQADSIFGCVLVLHFVYPMSLSFYFLYVFLGAITHIVVNMILYMLKLRKNML